MEHELRVDAEGLVQTEAGRVVLAVRGKLLAKLDEHAVEPSQDVGAVVDFSLEDGSSSHEHGGGFLIKVHGDGRCAGFGEASRDGGHAESELTRGVLIVRDKLDGA